jgi:hypothetical protein
MFSQMSSTLSCSGRTRSHGALDVWPRSQRYAMIESCMKTSRWIDLASIHREVFMGVARRQNLPQAPNFCTR